MTWSSLTLLRPWWLLALVPAAILLWRLGQAAEGDGGIWRRVVDEHLLPHVLVAGNPRRRRLGLALLAAGLVIAIVALAGPNLERGSAESYRRDSTRVLVVDLSPAMAEPARLEKLRLKILGLLRAVPEGQTALVAYAGEPYLVVPPTTDGETIARFVPELAPDALPVSGNRPDRAIAMAARVLERSTSGTRDLVWITAGAGGAPAPAISGFRLSILHVAEADEPRLAALANRSGGAYLHLTEDDGDVRQLTAAMESGGGWISATGPGKAEGADAGYWLLLPLLPLAALAFRRGLLAILLAPLLLAGFLGPSPAEAADLSPAGLWRDYQAWRRLRAGDSAGAADGFQDSRWQAVASYRAGQFDRAADLLEGAGDAVSLYNRGNALAKAGKLADALAAYEAALKLAPGDGDTVHNRDLVRRLLSQSQSAGRPPPPPPSRPREAEGEADRLARQWLRQVPDEPGTLLRRKLAVEHRRRQAGEVREPW